MEVVITDHKSIIIRSLPSYFNKWCQYSISFYVLHPCVNVSYTVGANDRFEINNLRQPLPFDYTHYYNSLFNMFKQVPP